MAPADHQTQQQSPGLLADAYELHSAIGSLLWHPLENIRMAAMGVQQFGMQFLGTAFTPERDITDQSGRVILVTGGMSIYTLLGIVRTGCSSADRESNSACLAANWLLAFGFFY